MHSHTAAKKKSIFTYFSYVIVGQKLIIFFSVKIQKFASHQPNKSMIWIFFYDSPFKNKIQNFSSLIWILTGWLKPVKEIFTNLPVASTQNPRFEFFPEQLPIEIQIQKFASRFFFKSAFLIFSGQSLKRKIQKFVSQHYSPKAIIEFLLDDRPFKEKFYFLWDRS